jgi:hypothetical protein
VNVDVLEVVGALNIELFQVSVVVEMLVLDVSVAIVEVVLVVRLEVIVKLDVVVNDPLTVKIVDAVVVGVCVSHDVVVDVTKDEFVVVAFAVFEAVVVELIEVEYLAVNVVALNVMFPVEGV